MADSTKVAIIVGGVALFGVGYYAVPEFRDAVDKAGAKITDWFEELGLDFTGGNKKEPTRVRINDEVFDEELPEEDIPKKETPKTGCYNSIAEKAPNKGKATTCYRQITPDGRYLAWCVLGTDRCGYARAEWCRNLSPNSASCKAILGTKMAFVKHARYYKANAVKLPRNN